MNRARDRVETSTDGYRVLGAGRNLDTVEKGICEPPGDGHRAHHLSDEIAAFADAEKTQRADRPGRGCRRHPAVCAGRQHVG